MWKKINSPIVITCIVIVALFVLRYSMKPKLATEIRGAYKELTSIIEDSASDAEKTKAIQKFAQEISSQLRAGFSSGFKSTESTNENKIYIETKKKIDIQNIKYVKSSWSGRDEFIFQVKNNSDKYIQYLRANCEFYKNGELIDCTTENFNNIKFLEPGQQLTVRGHRSVADKEDEKSKPDEIKIQITSFSIKEIE